MGKENVIQVKSYQFALDVIKLTKTIQKDFVSTVLLKQLLRSGTSVGANVEEAIGGFTKKDFTYKMSISHKEARESNYWLRLLKDSESLSTELANPLINQSEELIKILFVIIRNSRANGA
ncbi:MAG: four helix bundle protein [Cyclobacteriaceae bacterium]|nr:four helix bundle protein [Cyclobacteriaceae bacterium]